MQTISIPVREHAPATTAAEGCQHCFVLAGPYCCSSLQVSLRGADGVRVAFHRSNMVADVRQVLHALSTWRWSGVPFKPSDCFVL